MKNKNKVLIKNILLSLITIALFLFFFEVSLRTFGPKRDIVIVPTILMKSNNSILFYEMKPNASIIRNGINITINSKGMRDLEYEIEKKINVYRIAVLGDSVTANIDLNLSDIYTEKLERKLNLKVKNKKFEVLNFGVNGYGIIQELEVLREKVLKSNPDIVIIGYVLNDPLPSDTIINFYIKQEERKNNICKIYSIGVKIPCGLRDFVDELKIAEFIYAKLFNIKYTFGDDYYTRLYKNNSSYVTLTKSFNEIRMIAKRNNIKVVLVIFPLIKDLKNYRWEKIHSALSEEAIKSNFIVIDLLDEYRKYEEEKIKLRKNDILHPNKFGQEVAADFIYKRLSEENLITI